jgi:hypothetical protein
VAPRVSSALVPALPAPVHFSSLLPLARLLLWHLRLPPPAFIAVLAFARAIAASSPMGSPAAWSLAVEVHHIWWPCSWSVSWVCNFAMLAAWSCCIRCIAAVSAAATWAVVFVCTSAFLLPMGLPAYCLRVLLLLPLWPVGRAGNPTHREVRRAPILPVSALAICQRMDSTGMVVLPRMLVLGCRLGGATRSRAPNGAQRNQHSAGYRSRICLNKRRNTY